MTEIETDRLLLRQFTLNDWDRLAEIFSDADVMRYMSDGKPRTKAETKTTLEAFMRQWDEKGFGLWAVILKAEAKLIGQCGLFHLDNTPEIEVAYLFEKSYWGKGYASEAAQAALAFGFDTLKLDRIVAVTRPENVASQNVLLKNGLKFEKEANYYNLAVKYFALNKSDR